MRVLHSCFAAGLLLLAAGCSPGELAKEDVARRSRHVEYRLSEATLAQLVSRLNALPLGTSELEAVNSLGPSDGSYNLAPKDPSKSDCVFWHVRVYNVFLGGEGCSSHCIRKVSLYFDQQRRLQAVVPTDVSAVRSRGFLWDGNACQAGEGQ